MTILPPPRPRPRHECVPPDNPYTITRPFSALDTLWECPECERWWKYVVRSDCYATPNEPLTWAPVRWYDITARRRIANHETEKWHAQLRMTNRRTTARFHWWHCHPNPNRGRP